MTDQPVTVRLTLIDGTVLERTCDGAYLADVLRSIDPDGALGHLNVTGYVAAGREDEARAVLGLTDHTA